MTKEQMEANRQKVMDALQTQNAIDLGISDVEDLEFKDGDDLPIALVIDGESLVLELGVL